MNIKQIFDEISAESSTNKKVEILTKYKDNELLRKVLYLANSKRVKFYIKQLPNYIPVECEALEWGLDSLNPISERKITGNEAIGWLTNILSRLSVDDAYVIERIIEKDCRINVGRHLINKVWADLIEITPYQGCKPYSLKLIKKLFEKNGSAILQTKMD